MTILISPRQGSSLKLGPSQIFSLESNVRPFENPHRRFIYLPTKKKSPRLLVTVWVSPLHLDHWFTFYCRLLDFCSMSFGPRYGSLSQVSTGGAGFSLWQFLFSWETEISGPKRQKCKNLDWISEFLNKNIVDSVDSWMFWRWIFLLIDY